jgi:hypothetical protein
MTTPFVLITSHHIEPDRVDEIRKAAAEYSDFVKASEADMLAHHSYVSDGGDTLTLVHVLVDAAAADRHMEAAAELIGKGVALTEGNVRIDVLGAPGPILSKALESNRANGVQVTAAERGLVGFARAVSA